MLFIHHLNECNECVDYNSQWLMLLFVNIDIKYIVSLSHNSASIYVWFAKYVLMAGLDIGYVPAGPDAFFRWSGQFGPQQLIF